MIERVARLSLCGAVLCGLLSAQPAAKAGEFRQVYLVPFSHLDFFWAGTREECLSRGNRIIAKAIQLAKQFSDFRFLIEDDDFVANYMESHAGSADAEDLKRLVKERRIEISPLWAAIFQDLQDGEVLARNLVYGKRYARSVFGVDPQTAQLSDLPGYTPQYPQILRQADTPFTVMTRMGPSDKSLFYWKAPDGSKALTWSTLRGYGWGAHLGLHTDINDTRRATIEKEMAEVEGTTSGPIFMNWGSDLYAPNEKVAQNLAVLNLEIPGAQFAFATPDDYFAKAAHAPAIPELSGEIPSSWPNIVASLPHLWQLVVPAENTLLAAEKFAAINYALHYADYPQPVFDFLWKKLIESTDHNHDGQGGWPGDERKRSYSELALIRGGEILRDSLRNIAERVRIPVRPSFPLVVFNPLGWQRDDMVKAHISVYGDVVPGQVADYRKGMRLVDESGRELPFHIVQYSENVSRALDIVFVATAVPSLGYKTYYLRPADGLPGAAQTAQVTLDNTNDVKDPRRPLGSDSMENQYYRVTVDRATGRVTLFDRELRQNVVKDAEIVATEERGGNYIGIEPLSGRAFPEAIDKIEVEENNGVRAVMKIAGRLIDMPVTQRLILYKGLKRLDVENTLEWKGPLLVRAEQLFPYEAPNAVIQYGVAYGSNASSNLIPNTGPHMPDEISKESWLSSRHILDWISAGNADWGLTLATGEQFVRLSDGVLRGEMLRGARYTSVKVVRGDEVGVMDYPPKGVYTFRYSLSSGHGDWRARKSYRAGMGFNSPLLPIAVEDDVSQKSLPPTQSFFSTESSSLVLSAIKKADTNGDIVLRVFEAEGASTATPLSFLGRMRGFTETNFLEDAAGQPEQQRLVVKPYEIKTVRLTGN
ncbi:MAG TPA: glycosyl hydrolase-related protein [Bryobacteraceae bacterium]|nr:glycosyl hydrolase-related protein [Bryobacteraceae bacterium]